MIDANETSAQVPNAVHVIVPNLGHVVTASDEIGCTLGIVHRFVRELGPGNTDCVNKVRPVRTVPLFARTASELEPLQPLKGDKTSDAQRQIAAAALEAVGDAIARWYVTYNSSDTGLRGGKFTYRLSGATYIYKLTAYQ